MWTTKGLRQPLACRKGINVGGEKTESLRLQLCSPFSHPLAPKPPVLSQESSHPFLSAWLHSLGPFGGRLSFPAFLGQPFELLTWVLPLRRCPQRTLTA